jgi:hypothetical protein
LILAYSFLICWLRQKIVDYSVSEALKQLRLAVFIVLFIYDIACQWSVHFAKRFKDGRLLHLPDNIKLIPAVGKWHLAAHILACFFVFSLNFIKGAGQVDGEILETLWSELDKVAGFVRGMSEAHRQEVLDDLMNDSNWKKMIRMVDFLIAKLDRARDGLEATKPAFECLTELVGEPSVSEWKEVERRAFEPGGIGGKVYAVEIDDSRLSLHSFNFNKLALQNRD